MKILILANDDVGLYKFRKELVEELIRRGHNIYISLPDGDLVRPFEKMGCTFINTVVDRRGINPKRDFCLFLKYRKIIEEVIPDLIITYTIKPNIYGGIAARLAKKKYAVNITGLGTAFQGHGALRQMVTAMYKVALKKAKAVFFENSANRDLFIREKIVRIPQACLLHGAGVNLLKFPYEEYPENDVFHFLFIGRVMKEKGIDELFESMKRLIAEGQNCFLDVVGPFEEDYKEKLDVFEREGWLKYHGFQEDVRPFIKACDCFVLPSYHEGMANTNLEAAATGRPVITSNIPGCKEAVTTGSGFLCEPKNTDSLSCAMDKMIRADNREEMGRIGRKHIEAVFDKRIVVKETINSLFEEKQ